MNKKAFKAAFYGVVGAVLMLSSCQREVETPQPGNQPNLRPLTTNEVKTVDSSNDFAFRVFDAIRTGEKNENLFISPFSISAALTMAYNGADGSTKEAMRQVLGFELQNDEQINQAYKSLMELLVNMDRKVTFTSANSIWHAQQYKLQAPFVEKNKSYFDATVQALDFTSPATAKDIINNWVKEKTKDKIPGVIDQIQPEDVMFLINAIYFKGTWTYSFDKQQTQKASFRKENGATVEVDLMTMRNGKYLLYQDADKQVIDLPYGNGQYSMTIIVPAGQNKVSSVAAGLTGTQLTEWLSQADSTSWILRMPKFKMTYKQELGEILSQMGMAEAFNSSANFSRMLEDSNIRVGITGVMHRSFVEVNEEGTEAAAVTSVGVGIISMPPSVEVNRPFVFLIREKSSNAILFMGQMMDPTAQ